MKEVVLALFSVLLLLAATTLPSVSVVHSGYVWHEGIGIYWNPDCTEVVFEIDWGLLPRGLSESVNLFVRNEGDFNVTLLDLTIMGWDPPNPARYIHLDSNFSGSLAPNQTVVVALTVSVDPDAELPISATFEIWGICSFEGPLSHSSIVILNVIRVSMLGDLNFDGKINIEDIVQVALAFGSLPGGTRWNFAADLNEDNAIDIMDLVMVALHFGETS